MGNWLKNLWNSTESLTTWSFWVQLAAASLAFGALVLTLRKDRLDRENELGGERELADTKAIAAQANERAENTRKANLELQLRVEAERMARIRSEERFAWRRLTEEQRSFITSKLLKFPKHVASLSFI